MKIKQHWMADGKDEIEQSRAFIKIQFYFISKNSIPFFFSWHLLILNWQSFQLICFHSLKQIQSSFSKLWNLTFRNKIKIHLVSTQFSSHVKTETSFTCFVFVVDSQSLRSFLVVMTMWSQIMENNQINRVNETCQFFIVIQDFIYNLDEISSNWTLRARLHARNHLGKNEMMSEESKNDDNEFTFTLFGSCSSCRCGFCFHWGFPSIKLKLTFVNVILSYIHQILREKLRSEENGSLQTLMIESCNWEEGIIQSQWNKLSLEAGQHFAQYFAQKFTVLIISA